MGHADSEIVRELGISRSRVSRLYRENTDGGKKSSDRPNYKGQLALNERGVRRFSHIVRNLRSQTLAQINTQLNQGASRTVSKRTVQRSLHRMGFGSRWPKRVPLLNACHRAARLSGAREHREWTLEDCKRVAWSAVADFYSIRSQSVCDETGVSRKCPFKKLNKVNVSKTHLVAVDDATSRTRPIQCPGKVSCKLVESIRVCLLKCAGTGTENGDTQTQEEHSAFLEECGIALRMCDNSL
ncbi:hypothetical protein AVEN_43663-1 [Araneus ventricosus]|uniref:Transposase Tc1-like domain-containing protein n=1 Tax=Araneus ventricosus TaxID=182803 RepID=A0A4Y2IZ39_ARAVE|nr:hypothetical protein AVEN_43663-1 [Araneus ventricosus]